MSSDEWVTIVSMISSLWGRPADADQAVAAFGMFEDVEARDARTALKDLFAEGLEFPPSPSVLLKSSRVAEGRRVAVERRTAPPRPAIDKKRDPNDPLELRRYAELNNGFSPVQVFTIRSGGDPGPAKFPELYDPDVDIDPPFVPVRPYRGGQEAAMKDPF